jgi:hypothetical protein
MVLPLTTAQHAVRPTPAHYAGANAHLASYLKYAHAALAEVQDSLFYLGLNPMTAKLGGICTRPSLGIFRPSRVSQLGAGEERSAHTIFAVSSISATSAALM